VVAKPDVLTAFARRARYFNPFAGSPVCRAAGLAVIDVIERERLMANALSVGSDIIDGLKALAAEYPSTALFICVDFVKDRDSRQPAPRKPSGSSTACGRSTPDQPSGADGHMLKISAAAVLHGERRSVSRRTAGCARLYLDLVKNENSTMKSVAASDVDITY
jgi:4-aminobutyrate aminotransferase-like enzyme